MLDVYKFYEEFDTTPRWKIGSYKRAGKTQLEDKRLQVCVAHHMALITQIRMASHVIAWQVFKHNYL